ncbi:MAG: hypothetical protein IPM38_07355 [Ignavibacteria bacterium]|nr:hypothetical protein [Ignavibacteria bacterium]
MIIQGLPGNSFYDRGIVIETRKNWTTENMDIKGGNMVYVYDNFTNGLFFMRI